MALVAVSRRRGARSAAAPRRSTGGVVIGVLDHLQRPAVAGFAASATDSRARACHDLGDLVPLGGGRHRIDVAARRSRSPQPAGGPGAKGVQDGWTSPLGRVARSTTRTRYPFRASKTSTSATMAAPRQLLRRMPLVIAAFSLPGGSARCCATCRSASAARDWRIVAGLDDVQRPPVARACLLGHRKRRRAPVPPPDQGRGTAIRARSAGGIAGIPTCSMRVERATRTLGVRARSRL